MGLRADGNTHSQTHMQPYIYGYSDHQQHGAAHSRLGGQTNLETAAVNILLFLPIFFLDLYPLNSKIFSPDLEGELPAMQL